MADPRHVLRWLVPVVLMGVAGRAGATPSFNLVVSTGSITHLAVGEKLQLHAYLPLVFRKSPKPIETPLTWRVKPVDQASVTREGLLTALRPGRVSVTVESADVPSEELLGRADLTILEKLPWGRLPRVDGAHELESFQVGWDRSGYDQNRGLIVHVATIAWSTNVTTTRPPSDPLPWVLEAVRERSRFNDDQGYQDLFGPADLARWRKNLTSARLTITSWNDGIATGRVELTTTRGVNLDLNFTSTFEDRDGALARAASASVPAWAMVASEQVEAAKTAGVPVAFENSIGMRFVRIPAGKFTMGSPATEPGRSDDEQQHEVTLTKPFYLAVFDTTNDQYRKFKPDERKGDVFPGERPVVLVSHEEAMAFVAWLNLQERSSIYRLPTEAEWEYACRAGTTTPYAIDSTSPQQKANGDDDPDKTAPMSMFPPNAWGLHAMNGYVWQWCADWYGRYPSGAVTDPTGPDVGDGHVLRGGSPHDDPGIARSAARNWLAPARRIFYRGFRVCVSAAPAH